MRPAFASPSVKIPARKLSNLFLLDALANFHGTGMDELNVADAALAFSRPNVKFTL